MMERSRGKVSAQTQRLILQTLRDFNDWSGVSTEQAAKLLGKPKFTAMRAFDELAVIDPDLIGSEGRVRWLVPGANRKAFLGKVASHLFNPAVREYRLAQFPAVGHLSLSGLSAICHHAGLEEPPFPTYAITKAEEKALGLIGGKGLASWREWDEPACIVHVMSYDLDSMSEAAVDPISAILTLSDEEMEDPEVGGAVMRALEKVLAGR